MSVAYNAYEPITRTSSLHGEDICRLQVHLPGLSRHTAFTEEAHISALLYNSVIPILRFLTVSDLWSREMAVKATV